MNSRIKDKYGFTVSVTGLFERMRAHEFRIETKDYKGNKIYISDLDVEEVTLQKIWIKNHHTVRLLDKPRRTQVRFIEDRAEVYSSEIYDNYKGYNDILLSEIEPIYTIFFKHRIDGE